jgi:uncharacterized membrane protein
LNPKLVGAIAGLVAGIIIVHFGFLKAVVVGVFVLAGWFVGKIWMGEIDLVDIYERLTGGRGKGRRR